MDIKKLKTSELLDQIESEKDDERWGLLVEEIRERTPFIDIYYSLEELEKKVDKLVEEIEDVKDILKSHTHLDGNVVVKV